MNDLVKIRDISVKCNVSARTLRYYEGIIRHLAASPIH